jgi:hypothetical protein
METSDSWLGLGLTRRLHATQEVSFYLTLFFIVLRSHKNMGYVAG